MKNPLKTLNVGFFMFRSKTTKSLNGDEKSYQYDTDNEINPELIAKKYFTEKTSLNQWFFDSSYGNVALMGTVIGWIDYPEELSAEQMSTDSDKLFTYAAA